MYEHRCLENIKKLNKSARKCDDKQQYKAIIEDSMVSTTERFDDKITMSSGTYVPVKELNTRKSLHQFSETLDVKPKTAVRWLCTAKSNHKVTISGSMFG